MNRRSRSALSLLTALLPLGLLAACAELQVRSVSSQPAEPAYELRGPSLAHLRAEVARRCPQGHVVWREAERQTRRAGDNILVTSWNRAMAWLDDDDVQAQMAVSCRGAATPPREALTIESAPLPPGLPVSSPGT